MRETGRLFRTCSYLVSIAVACLAVSGKPVDADFALGGIKDGLKRSPEHYVAAVMEVVSPPTCKDPKVSSTCLSDTKLVEVLSSRGGAFEPGKVLVLLGNPASGARYLGFLVPLKGRPGIFGATFLSGVAGEEGRTTFVDALKKAGLSEQPGTSSTD